MTTPVNSDNQGITPEYLRNLGNLPSEDSKYVNILHQQIDAAHDAEVLKRGDDLFQPSTLGDSSDNVEKV